MNVGIVTSNKGISLIRVAVDIGRIIKEETGAKVKVFKGYDAELFRMPEDSKFIIVMPFDPSPALPYFYTAWELRKFYSKVLFYTTIEGKVYKPSVPQWVIRDFEYIANSMYTARRLEEAGVRISDIIYHGVDIEAFSSSKSLRESGRKRLGVSEDDFVIGYIAGCYPRKGHSLFAETLKLLEEKDPQIKAFILTSDKCVDYYVNLNNAIPLTDFGNLTDRDIIMLYHSLDLYVQASLGEGFGLPVLEALASGKLVVHPDYEPLSEITTSETSVRVPVSRIEFKREYGSIEYEYNYYEPNEMVEAILYAKDMVIKQRKEIEDKCVERAKVFELRKVYKRFIELLR